MKNSALDYPVGRSDAHISIEPVNRDGVVWMIFYIPDNKMLFDELFLQKEEIEEKLGYETEWNRLEGKKAARIQRNIPGLNFDDHSNYESLMNEIIDEALKIRDVFKIFI